MGFFDGPTTVTNSNPWAMASPYLQDIMQQAQQLYGQQAPQYQNPSSNFGFGQATGAVGNALSGNTALGSMTNQISPIATGAIGSSFASPFGTAGGLDATGAIKQQLSGTPDYTAVNGAIDAANTQQWNQFYNGVVPQLNQRASFLGNPSGAIKDLNSAITNIGQNQSLNAQQAYLGQYNLAQQQKQAAAQLVAQGGLQTQQNALGLGQLGGNLATSTGQQALTGAGLYPGIAQMPQQNLQDYASTVSGTGGKFGSQTDTTQPGGAGTAATVVGGLTAGAGLANQLLGGTATGTPSSGGLVGQIGSLFGSGAPAAGGALGTGALGSGAAATGAVGSTLGTVGSTTAGDSAAIAAGNDAWLASQPAAAGGAVGSGAGAAGAAGAAAGLGSTSAAGVGAAASGGFATGGAAGAGIGSTGTASGSLAGVGAGAGYVALPVVLDMLLRNYTNIDTPSLGANLASNFMGNSKSSSGTDRAYTATASSGGAGGPPTGITYSVKEGGAGANGGGISGTVAAAKPTMTFTGPNGKTLDSSFDWGQAAQLYNAAYIDPKLANPTSVAAYDAYIKQHGG